METLKSLLNKTTESDQVAKMEILCRRRRSHINQHNRILITIAVLLLLSLGTVNTTTDNPEENDDDLEDLGDLEDLDDDVGKVSEAEAVSRAQRIVADLTNENAERVISSHEYVLLLGYAPWCARSADLMPEFAFAATTLKEMGSPILFAKLDGDRHTKAASRYGIKGYPTLLLFVNGTSQVYTGGFTGDEIVIWVRKKTGLSTLRLSSFSEAEEFLKKNWTSAVGFFKEFEGIAYEEFVQAAIEDNEVQFVEVSNLEVAKFLNPEINYLPQTLGLVKSEPEKLVLFEGEFKKGHILQFVEENKYPLVTRLTEHNSAKVYSRPIKLQLFLFAGAHEFESILSYFQDAARKFKSKIMFLLVDSTDDNLAKPLLTLFGLEPIKPIVVAFDYSIGSKYHLESEITISSLEDFCSQLLTGNLLPYYKSEPIPVENKGDVQTVVGKTFDDIVINSSADVLLEAYTPWCMNCKAMSKLIDKVAKHFKGVPSLVIARIDASANEHPNLQVHDSPTIPVSTRSSLKDLIQFVRDNAGAPLREVRKFEEGPANANEKVDSEIKDEL
eukprot:Gb_19724 [translate_table: standard]